MLRSLLLLVGLAGLARADLPKQAIQAAEKAGLVRWEVIVEFDGRWTVTEDWKDPKGSKQEVTSMKGQFSAKFYAPAPSGKVPAMNADVTEQVWLDARASGTTQYTWKEERRDAGGTGSWSGPIVVKDARATVDLTDLKTFRAGFSIGGGPMSGHSQFKCQDEKGNPKTCTNADPRGADTMSFDLTPDHAKATWDPKGQVLVIAGNLSKPETSQTSGGTEKHDTSERVTITMRPAKTTYEAILRPVDKSLYESWEPKATGIPGVAVKTDPTSKFMVELRDSKSHQPVAIAYGVAFELTEVSRHPGTCMNFPPPKAAKGDPDVYIDGAKNRGLVDVRDGGARAPVTMGAKSITLSARDMGAYARLHATVTVDGQTIEARTEDGKAAWLPLPYDDNANRIADSWEKRKLVDKDAKALDDKESTPGGLAAKGDGYTLYEEYRGFVLVDDKGKEAWKNLDPRKQDFLVHVDRKDPFVAQIREGIATFGKAASLVVSYTERVETLDHDRPGFPRWDNFNAFPHDGTYFGQKQAAIPITSTTAIPIVKDTKTGKEGPVTSPAQTPNTTPDTNDPPLLTPGVFLYPANARQTIKNMLWFYGTSVVPTDPKIKDTMDQYRARARAAGYDPIKVAAAATPKLETFVKRMVAFTVAHELGHALAGKHHDFFFPDWEEGDPSCPLRYWQFDDTVTQMKWFTEKWTGSKAPDGTEYEFCDHNRKQMRLTEK